LTIKLCTGSVQVTNTTDIVYTSTQRMAHLACIYFGLQVSFMLLLFGSIWSGDLIQS